MRILVTGATGLIGIPLVQTLVQQGFEIRVLSRNPDASRAFSVPVDVVNWSGPPEPFPVPSLEEISGLIHLMGENVASRRWSEEQKRKIYDSRVQSTRQIAEAIQRHGHSLGFYVGASAVGYYGDRGEEVLTEKSPPGNGFLADVCQQWEAAAAEVPAQRKVIFRFGAVMSTRAGMLSKMLPLFRAGVAGPVGKGDQWIPWIHEEDLVRVLVKSVFDTNCEGTFNAASPNPVTNREFGVTLAELLNKPFVVPTPAFALKLALGEMADLALDSTRAVGSDWVTSQLTYPRLDECLKDLLKI